MKLYEKYLGEGKGLEKLKSGMIKKVAKDEELTKMHKEFQELQRGIEKKQKELEALKKKIKKAKKSKKKGDFTVGDHVKHAIGRY